LSGEAVVGAELARKSGSLSVVIPSGTQVKVSAHLIGKASAKLGDLRISTIGVSLYSPGGADPNVSVRVLNTDLPVIFVKSATFSAGGRVQVDYTVVTESLEAVFRLLFASEALREGRPVGESALDYRQPAAHAIVDAQIKSQLQPLLRDLVFSKRNMIPGIDLVEVLGY
jgi:hypothetical protein